MTPEQIQEEAKKRYVRKGYTRDAFIAGAEWASENSCGWVDLKDRKPKDGTYVFLTDKNAHTIRTRYQSDRKMSIDYNYWLPCPRLPHWI